MSEPRCPSPAPASAMVEYFARVEHAFDSAIARTAPIERYYAVADRVMLLRFASRGLLAKLHPAFAHLQVAPAPHADVSVGLWDTASTGVPLPNPPVAAYRRARGYLTTAPDAAIPSALDLNFHAFSIADAARGVAFFQVSEADAVPSYETAFPLRAILNWILRREGRQLVHGGAVGTADGAVLITGSGGAGKSNTCLSALAAGMLYAGDDYVLLGAGDPRVHSIYCSAKLFPADLSRFETLAPSVAEHAAVEGDKSVLFLHPQCRERLATSMPLRAILLPRIVDADDTHLRPVARAASLEAMAPTTLLQLPGAGALEFATMARVAAAAPSYVLELGRERSQAPALIAQLLAELRST